VSIVAAIVDADGNYRVVVTDKAADLIHHTAHHERCYVVPDFEVDGDRIDSQDAPWICGAAEAHLRSLRLNRWRDPLRRGDG
jgi:hypothetical protein